MKLTEQIFRTTSLFISIFFFIVCTSPKAQFLTVEIDVEPEVNAAVEQPLDFGQITVNAGTVQYELGSPSMGKFSIRAIRTQRLLVSVDVPETLQHISLDAAIPFDIGLAVTSNGTDNWRQADLIDTYPADVVFRRPDNQPDSEWSIAYLYVYGTLDVGNVPLGTYTGDVIMNVEYY